MQNMNPFVAAKLVVNCNHQSPVTLSYSRDLWRTKAANGREATSRREASTRFRSTGRRAGQKGRRAQGIRSMLAFGGRSLFYPHGFVSSHARPACGMPCPVVENICSLYNVASSLFIWSRNAELKPRLGLFPSSAHSPSLPLTIELTDECIYGSTSVD